MIPLRRVARCVAIPRAIAWLLALAAGQATALSPVSAADAPDLVLITLDTVRADELGSYGGAARTPMLDALAASGIRYARALSPVPLTLPAHASLLTGLDPDEHGLRDNGGGALPKAARTVAELLRGRGYATFAAVGSRVLDRRFGLDRGFDVYDDRMLAERIGEFGYAERPAAEVVDVLLRASAGVDARRPRFLWAHFYDAHAPYEGSGADERTRYRSEIELLDREVGRLLSSLPAGRKRFVIVVADHGESFGEHHEHEHGYLLHQPTLAVPLLVSGPGIAPGSVVSAPVATRRVAATLSRLAGNERRGEPAIASAPLPWVDGGTAEAIYHETEFPASTFGWSPLAAVTKGRWRLVQGPKAALYDLVADPGELVNRLDAEPAAARDLVNALRRFRQRERLRPEEIARDAALSEALAGLGYLSGASNRRGTLDPAEGVRLLPQFAEANAKLAAGEVVAARAALRSLVATSPASTPFLTQLAAAEQAGGDFVAARKAHRAAIAVNPSNEFLWSAAGDLERAAGKPEAAEAAYREALRLSPRMAATWMALAEMLFRSGRAADEVAALRAAVAAECESAAIYARLGEVELGLGEVKAADAHARRATELLPDWAPAWRLWAQVASRQGRADAAAERAARAAALSRR